MAKTKIVLFSLIIFLLTAFQVLPVIRSGLNYSFGLGFWGPNGHDGIWHLALINQIHQPFVINHPTFAGSLLQNYHPFFDILIAYLSAITSINSSLLLFQIFPVINATLLMLLSFNLGRRLTGRAAGGLLLCFATSTMNSFGWLVSFFQNGTFGGESLFWSMQSASIHLNPPLALSFTLLLTLLTLLTSQKINRRIFSLALVILSVLLPVTKLYTGAAWFIFFFLYSLLSPSDRRKKLFSLFSISTIFALVLFLVYNHNSGQLLVFDPFWFPRTVFSSVDKLYIPKIASFIYNARLFDPRLWLVIALATVIFIVGNLGWRLLALFSLPQIRRSNLLFCLLLTSLFLIIFPLLFIQKGTAWNTIQFFYVAQFLFNLLFVVAIFNFPRRLQKILIITIVFTTLLSNLEFLKNYLGWPPPAYLSQSELQALNYLRRLPSGAILTPPYNQYENTTSSTPIPLALYQSTAYVAAYSSHPVFLDDEMNLAISNYDYQSRLAAETEFFKLQNPIENRGFLLNNHLDYIYISKAHPTLPHFDLTLLGLKVIYENSSAIVYQVLK